MAKLRKKFELGVLLKPTTTAAALEGEVRVDSADGKLKAYLDGAERSLVSENQSQTLTSKTIDADDNTISNLEVDNLKSGVLNTSTSMSGASDTQVPSALAIKTYVDNSVAGKDDASEITYSNATSGLTATNVQDALDEIDQDVDDLNTLSGVAKNATTLGTFTGTTIPDSQTVKQALQSLETAHEEVDQNANDLITLSGVAENSVDLGTFTGTTIPDSQTVKQALQALETAVESKADSSSISEIDANVDDLITLSGVAENSTNLGTFTGSTIPDNQNNKQALQALETAHEAHLNDTSDAHDASAISSVPSGNLAATDVQAALNELQSDIDTRALNSDLTTHTSASSGVHGVTGSVVGTTDTQTIQNKTINTSKIGGGTASNTNKTLVSKDTFANLNSLTKEEASVYYATDAKKLYYDDGTSLLEVGSGSGSGINYITNNSFEVNDTGWVEYADAVQETPVDGVGAGATITFSRSTSSPLRGTASGLLSKGAVNERGEGVSYNFTIDTADQAKVLEVSFDYTVTANYADGHARIYVYDVTNAQLIELSQRDLLANSGQASYKGYFQAASNSTSYRLIIHIATDSALAWDLKIDNVRVGPASAISSGKVTTMRAVGGNTSIPINSAVDLVFPTIQSDSTGAYNSSNGQYTIPEAGWYIVTGQIRSTSFTLSVGHVFSVVALLGGSTVASGNTWGTGATQGWRAEFSGQFYANKGQILKIQGYSSTTATALNTSTFDNIFSVSKISSDSASQGSSVVAAKMKRSVNQTGVNPNNSDVKVLLNTSIYDTSGAFDSANSRYIIPESGYYSIDGMATTGSTNVLADAYAAAIYKNGSAIRYGDLYNGIVGASIFRSVTCQEYFNKGDIIELYLYARGNHSVNTLTIAVPWTFLDISKISTPAIIAPTEFVGCSYKTDAGQNISSSTQSVVVFEDREYDSHNAMNTSTGIYTIPVSGIYAISSSIAWAATAQFGGTEIAYCSIFKNSSTFIAREITNPSSNSTVKNVSVYDEIYLVKGDTIAITAFQDSGLTLNLNNVQRDNRITIRKIG